MDFDAIITGIRKAIYGREVREYIASSMEWTRDFVNQSITNIKELLRQAEAARDAAKASQDAAKASENAAKASQNAAASSASAAAGSASAAKTSETNAKASENAAKTSETKAKTSETNAKTSETNAKASADSMGTSVATCTTKAKEAEASAGKAAASEGNAKTSEGNAKASENEARQLVEAAKKVVNTDKTLTIDGAPADAKTVGDKFKSIFERIKSIKMDWNSVTDKPSTFPSTWGSVSGKPSVYPTNWGNVSGKPSSYPPSDHTHSYITNGGDATAITGAIGTAGLSLQQAYNNGYPTTYGNVLSIGGHGDGQILAGWSGSNNGIERLYYRNRCDMCNTWSDWRAVAFTTDVTQITSQTSDPGAGSSLATGSILLVYA